MMHFNSTAPELQQAAKYYGIYSRLARRLGVTPQHVRHVALGFTRSARVSRAIAKEMERIRKSVEERAA